MLYSSNKSGKYSSSLHPASVVTEGQLYVYTFYSQIENWAYYCYGFYFKKLDKFILVSQKENNDKR